MSRCFHRWCEVEQAGSWRRFVFRCSGCSAVVEYSVMPYGLHADVVNMGRAEVTPDDIGELAGQLLELAMGGYAPAPRLRRRKKLSKVA